MPLFKRRNKAGTGQGPVAEVNPLVAPPGVKVFKRSTLTAPPTRSTPLTKNTYKTPFVDKNAAEKAERLRMDHQEKNAPKPGMHTNNREHL